MNPFDKILKSNNQPSSSTKKVGLYDDILADIKTPASKVSKLDIAKNVGKEIVKGIIKLPARAATNVAQTVQGLSKLPEVLRTGKTTITPVQPFSGKFLGDVKSIGTEGTMGQRLTDIGGAGLEVASYLPFAKAVKGGYTAGKALVTGGKEAAKQSLKGMAVEGAIGGGLQSLGQQTQQYSQDGTPISIGDVGKSTAAGAIFAPALGLVGRGIGKIFNRGEVPANLAVADEVTPTPKPKLTSQERLTQYSKSMGYEPYQNPSELPTIQLGSKGKETIPTIQIGGKKQPKVANYDELTYEPIPNQSISSQMPDTISSIIKNGKKAPELVEQAVKEANVAPKPVNTVSVDKAAKMLDTPDATDFQRQTNKLQVEQIMQKDQSEIIDIALGNKVPTDGLPAEAHYAVAANLADEMAKNGDSSLALRLADSPVRSKSGQGLQSLNITSKDNIVPILNDIKNKKEAKLSFLTKKQKQKDIDTAIKGIQDEFGKLKGLPNTREQIVEALNKLIC